MVIEERWMGLLKFLKDVLVIFVYFCVFLGV